MSNIKNNGAVPTYPIPDYVVGGADGVYSYVIRMKFPRFVATFGRPEDLDSYSVEGDSEITELERIGLTYRTSDIEIDVRTIRWDDPKPSDEEDIIQLLAEAGAAAEVHFQEIEDAKPHDVIAEMSIEEQRYFANMPSDHFCRIGERLFGEGWQETLIEEFDLGVDAKFLTEWSNGYSTIPFSLAMGMINAYLEEFSDYPTDLWDPLALKQRVFDA